MARRDWGGEIGRGVKTANGVFVFAGAIAVATLGTVACADANDPAIDEVTNSTEPSSDVTAAPSNVDDDRTEETDSASEPAESDAPAGNTSQATATAATGDESGEPAATNSDAGGPQASTNDVSNSDDEGEDQPAFPQADGPDYAFARGGTRLAAVHLAAAGAERFLHFYDRELERECAFEKVAGQSDYACAPVEPITVHYLDAACTQPILLSREGEIALARPLGEVNLPVVPVPQDFVGSLVTTRGPVSCSVERSLGSLSEETAPGSDLPARGEITGVYQVGENFLLTPDEDSTLTTVYLVVEGVCQSTSAMIRIRNPADSAYVLEPKTVDEFVTAQVQTFDAGNDFDVQRLLGSDGSWQTLGAVDKSGEACELIADGRCVPGPVAELLHVALFPSVTCDTPAVDVLIASGQPCDERYGVAATGETSIFELVPSADAGYYQRWQPLDPDTGEMLAMQCGGIGNELVSVGEAEREFPAAELQLVGAPVLRARTPVGAGTTVSLRRDVDFVLEDGSVCDVNLFDDGVYRCHPPTPGVIDGVSYPLENKLEQLQTDIYGDAECVHHIYTALTEVESDLPFWNLRRTFHAMEPFEGLLYQDYGGECSPLREPRSAIRRSSRPTSCRLFCR